MVVFVYGTLMRGEGNHGLLAASRFLGPARTPPAYQLSDLGEYPALVAAGRCSVVGELYEIDGETLAALDELEGHPEFYRRATIVLSDGTRAMAYLLAPERVAGRAVIASGDWRAHRCG